MYSVARFQFLQQAFLKFGIVPSHVSLAGMVHSTNFESTPNKNHLVIALREAAKDIPLTVWNAERPFPAKVSQVILHFLPSFVNSLNVANSARLGTSDPSVGFLVPECLDAVRVIVSNPALASRMRKFAQVTITQAAKKEIEDQLAQDLKILSTS